MEGVLASSRFCSSFSLFSSLLETCSHLKAHLDRRTRANLGEQPQRNSESEEFEHEDSEREEESEREVSESEELEHEEV